LNGRGRQSDLEPFESVETRGREVRLQVSWGLVSQAFSSATNFALSVIAGRLVGPRGLGVIYIGFAVYVLALSLQRALVTDPFVVATAGFAHAERAAATRIATTVVLVFAGTVSLLLLVVGAAFGGDVGRGLVLFAPWTGIALVQDSWRAALFRDRRGRAGAMNDVTWAVAMAATLPLALVVDRDWAVVAIWGAGAFAGAVLGVGQLRTAPERLGRSIGWWREHAWPLGRWLALESLFVSLGAQVVVFLLAAILGPRDVGGLRAVEAVFAPMTLVVQAIALPGLPLLSRTLKTSFTEARVWAMRLSLISLGLVVLYLGAVGAVRDQILRAVFGDAFTAFSYLIIPIGLSQLFYALSVGFALLLRADGRGRSLILGRFIGSGATLALIWILAVTNGLRGSAWGRALGAAVTAATMIALAQRHRRVATANAANESLG
jgi:O-antigen/teichoic acid export membrane protein